jgi:nucleoside-diphosphate-sugar epimerase
VRSLVTGGSGFIGTNLVEHLLQCGDEVLTIDTKEPRDKRHTRYYKRVDVLDRERLSRTANDFSPDRVLHLAARTDLAEKRNLSGYAANTTGIENLIHALSSKPTVHRVIFVSSQLVCKNGYFPRTPDEYCPDTLYGSSKVISEQVIKQSSDLSYEWCIVRPTSIWGPWFDVPYKQFFISIARGWYFNPGRVEARKSYGFVGNVVFQLDKLLAAPSQQIHGRTFYLTDYDPITIRRWADTISRRMQAKRIHTLPSPLVRMAAWGGDALQAMGWSSPPLTSFRLRNMRCETHLVPVEPIREITGPLPYSMEQGVDMTIEWLYRTQQLRSPQRLGRSAVNL